MTILTQDTGLRSGLLARMAANPDEVWVPDDFADLGNRVAVDKTLQYLIAAGGLRRIDRGPRHGQAVRANLEAGILARSAESLWCGTSLSKTYGLIQRFFDDIDITVFRENLGEPASVQELRPCRERSTGPDSMRSGMHTSHYFLTSIIVSM